VQHLLRSTAPRILREWRQRNDDGDRASARILSSPLHASSPWSLIARPYSTSITLSLVALLVTTGKLVQVSPQPLFSGPSRIPGTAIFSAPLTAGSAARIPKTTLGRSTSKKKMGTNQETPRAPPSPASDHRTPSGVQIISPPWHPCIFVSHPWLLKREIHFR